MIRIAIRIVYRINVSTIRIVSLIRYTRLVCILVITPFQKPRNRFLGQNVYYYFLNSFILCIHPSYRSILHSCNFVSVRSLPEMSAGCHNVAEIACGSTAQTVCTLPVAPQMFSCRSGGLSRAHSVGRTPRQCVTINIGSGPSKRPISVTP